MRYILSILFLTISLFGFDYHLKSYTMADGVECFFGLASKTNRVNGGNIVNSCYIETDEGYVVIDSGPTYSYAQQAYKIMREKKNIPVKYVINTSPSEAHILGNGFYKEQDAYLIGPKGYKTGEANYIHEIEDTITEDAFVNTRLTSLDKYVDKSYSLNISGLEIKIIRIIKDSDRFLTIHIPQKNIIFVGDMIFNNRLPSLRHGQSLIKWLGAIKKIEQISWKRIISAHGTQTKYSALKNTQSYLSILKERVEESIRNGEDINSALNTINLFSFMEDTLYEEWHTHNVSIAYNEISEYMKKNQPTKKTTPKIIQTKTEPKKTHVKKIVKTKKRKKVNAIPYYGFNRAMRLAKKNKKIVLLKIHSDNCPFCDELDRVLARNSRVKKIINRNYMMVGLNNSREKLPLGIEVKLTPSLVFIRPDTKKVTMITPGIEALGELINVLKEGILDGRSGGYLE